ncbi:hypothetical protein [Siminovitchia terrae]|uniref:hypothetical protein n=1 Tax=Siminovitchia terrae TaxID=1914933 RepID=UPI0035E412BC
MALLVGQAPSARGSSNTEVYSGRMCSCGTAYSRKHMFPSSQSCMKHTPRSF